MTKTQKTFENQFDPKVDERCRKKIYDLWAAFVSGAAEALRGCWGRRTAALSILRAASIIDLHLSFSNWEDTKRAWQTSASFFFFFLSSLSSGARSSLLHRSWSRVCQVRASQADSCHSRSEWRCSPQPRPPVLWRVERQVPASSSSAGTPQEPPEHTRPITWVALSPWQLVIDSPPPPQVVAREGDGRKLMTGKKWRQRMESDGVVGEKEANVRTEPDTNVARSGWRRCVFSSDIKALRSPLNVRTAINTNVLFYWFIISQKRAESNWAFALRSVFPYKSMYFLSCWGWNEISGAVHNPKDGAHNTASVTWRLKWTERSRRFSNSCWNCPQ